MRYFTIAVVLIAAAACNEEPAPQAAHEQEPTSPSSATGEGFILKVGAGEALLNGLVVKASPKTGTMGSILVEQTFQRGGTTNLHIHDQGDELFYLIGVTTDQRMVVVAHTERGDNIRIINARPAKRKEVRDYEQGSAN